MQHDLPAHEERAPGDRRSARQVAVVLLALGLALGYAWRQRSSSDELALRTHAIQGTVTLTDASGFCVASPVEERCARLVHGEAPAVGTTVRAEWVAFPTEDEGVLLWSMVRPSP